MVELKPCGTEAAYHRHIRRGEPLDDACRAAHARWKREQRARRREREDQAVVQQVSRASAFEVESGGDVVRVPVVLRSGGEPVEVVVPTMTDPVEAARWRLSKVRASMAAATPRDMAALAKREEEIVALLADLLAPARVKPPTLLDELRERRDARLARAPRED